MAYAKIAIVHGEWRMGPDSNIRLFILPTLEIISKPGVTQHVSAFAAIERRTDPAQFEPQDAFVYPSPGTSYSFGRDDEQASFERWLPQVSTDRTFHMLGKLADNCSPVFAVLFIKSAIAWYPPGMSPDHVCLADAVETNQYDGQIINLLKGLKTHYVDRDPIVA